MTIKLATKLLHPLAPVKLTLMVADPVVVPFCVNVGVEVPLPKEIFQPGASAKSQTYPVVGVPGAVVLIAMVVMVDGALAIQLGEPVVKIGVAGFILITKEVPEVVQVVIALALAINVNAPDAVPGVTVQVEPLPKPLASVGAPAGNTPPVGTVSIVQLVELPSAF